MKFIRFLDRLLPHAILILCLMLLTFWVIDIFNPAMAFLNNSLTKSLVAMTATLGILYFTVQIWRREQ